MILDGAPGEHISRAARRAIEAGAAALTFNEITIPVESISTPESIEAAYTRLVESAQERYRASPEGIAAAKRADDYRAECQRAVDSLVADLPEAAASIDATVQWLADFCQPANHIDVRHDMRKIFDTLAEADYTANFGVGNPPEWFSTRGRVGRYIIGQGMSCLAKGLPPHGNTITFAEKYRAMKA